MPIHPATSKMNADVKDMNVAFGNPEGDPAIFENSDYSRDAGSHEADVQWKRLEKQCMNIKAEYEELMHALATRDTAAVRDALCDINVFSLGAHHLMGYDADADMEEVVGAVMTRFCADQKQLQATMEHFNDKGVLFTIEGAFPRVYLKSTHDQGRTVAADGSETWEYPKGKFLKAVGYRTPNLLFATRG